MAFGFNFDPERLRVAFLRNLTDFKLQGFIILNFHIAHFHVHPYKRTSRKNIVLNGQGYLAILILFKIAPAIAHFRSKKCSVIKHILEKAARLQGKIKLLCLLGGAFLNELIGFLHIIPFILGDTRGVRKRPFPLQVSFVHVLNHDGFPFCIFGTNFELAAQNTYPGFFCFRI